MITIYSDSKKIYDPRIEKLQLEEAELSQAKNKAGTLKFIIPTDHEYADLAITPGVTRVTVKEDDETLLRVVSSKTILTFGEIQSTQQKAIWHISMIRSFAHTNSPEVPESILPS